MSNLRTTEDLLIDALRKAGEKTDGTSQYANDALEYMNAHYKNILAGATMFEATLGEPWSWAKSRYPTILQLKTPYETGTVSLTADSTAGTFSSAPSISLTDRFLKVTDRPDFMRIASHTAGLTAFTLDGIYSDTTASSLSFKAYQLDYTLGATGGGTDGILRLFAPMRVHRSQTSEADETGTISELDERNYAEKYPLSSIQTGTPTEYAIVGNNDGLITVRFNKTVNVATRVEVDTIQVPDPLTNLSTSIPLIPEAHREVLSFCTAYSILFDKEDDKSNAMFQLAKAKLQAMVNAQRKSRQNARRNFGRLIPRPDQVERKLWRTRG